MRSPPPNVSDDSPPSVATAILGLTDASQWDLATTVPIAGNVGHPQGMAPGPDGVWLITTVELETFTGLVLTVDGTTGDVVDRVTVATGDQLHPGGTARDPEGALWIACAEYRPDSTTTVRRLDPGGTLTDVFGFDDHLGLIVPRPDGTLFAASWGSRVLYLLDLDGHVLAKWTNPSDLTDGQDGQASGDLIVMTGVSALGAGGSPERGGLTVINPATQQTLTEVVVTATTATGRNATYNPTWLTADADGLVVTAAPDDSDQGSLVTWRVAAF